MFESNAEIARRASDIGLRRQHGPMAFGAGVALISMQRKSELTPD
jgi:hypothetical protein